MSALRAHDAPGVGVRTGVWSISRTAVEHLSLGCVLLLSAVLNVINLASEGYANTYYAAAVKSMAMSFHNFFFVSFDPAGFVAVDKPPLGLWLQVVSVKLLGFSGVSMLLPQAIAGVLSVFMLWVLVSRVFGRPAGTIAALALAITPISVVDNRNNTSDSVLILMLLLAAWAVFRAIETGRLRWLVVGAICVGAGFNIKELEAYLILPALAIMYLCASPHRLLTRIWHLLVGVIVVLVVSFSWIIAVDLTPANARPFVSDSGTNSELSLAMGYNGFGRLATGLLSRLPTIPILHVKLDFTIVPAISAEIGNPSALRLFEPAIGGQASWLLPFALIGLVAACTAQRPRFPLSTRHASLLFWGTWLITLGIFFSVARFYHLYYLGVLGPAVSALAGIGLVALWNEYRGALAGESTPPWAGWLLPAALVITALVQMHLLAGYPGWNGWLGIVVVAATLAVAVVLLLGRLRVQFLLAPNSILRIDRRVALVAAALGVAALLAPPGAFAATSISGNNAAAWLPQAGPSVGFGAGGFGGFRGFGRGGGPGNAGGFGASGQRGSFTPPSGGFGGGTPPGGSGGGNPPPAAGNSTGRPAAGSNFGFGTQPTRGRFGGGGGGGAITFAGPSLPALDPKLLHYLSSHRGSARYLVATMTSSYASLFILKTGQAVMTLGGYQGWDKILTPAKLASQVSSGAIRFFLVPQNTGGPGGGFFGAANLGKGIDANLNSVNDDLVTWVKAHCAAVPVSAYTTTSATSASGIGAAARGGFNGGGAGLLYDCSKAAKT